MRVPDLIAKKRDGNSLGREELRFILDGYLAGRIADYQISALLMAIFFRGMTDDETVDLTELMAASGDQLDLSGIPGVKVDKHSTGGVGDKTSLVVLPLAAACGAKTAKLSGRGLGHTGGTIDKLEAIPGFTCDLSEEAFLAQGRELGLVLGGQTGNLVPADKKLYALRDVTATVDSIPLIAASVMSKKLASGADAIVLDVKCGSGAFMKTEEEALKLADLLVKIGEAHGKPTSALVTSMERPLGLAVGNALEVNEALATLRGEGPEELTTLCIELATEMIFLAARVTGEEKSREAVYAEVSEALNSGAALEQFRKWIAYQGGDTSFIDNGGLPVAAFRKDFTADTDGYLSFNDTEAVGLASLYLGAGRSSLEDKIDPGAGLYFHVQAGESVRKGQSIVTMYSSDEAKFAACEKQLAKAMQLLTEPAKPGTLILRRVSLR